MATGIVRSFNDSKGFGLISPDLGGPPLFARIASVTTPNTKKLKVLQRVSYDVHETLEGLFATNIALVRD